MLSSASLAPMPPPIRRPSRLLERIHREIGMAAVAKGLALKPEKLDPELAQAIERGARYIELMPSGSARTPQPTPG